MKTQVVLVCSAILAISIPILQGDADEVAPDKIEAKNLRRQLFQKKSEQRVEALRTATPDVLAAAIREDLPGDIPVSQIVSNMEYRVSEGMIRDILETEIGPTSDGRVSVELSVEYLRRIVAISELAKTKPDGALEWLVSRKNRETPTLLDALMCLAACDGGGLVNATKGKQEQWGQLMRAKNPFCRIIAVTYAPQWVAEEDVNETLTGALSDEYWYVRFKALELADKKASPSAKDLLERFVNREIRERLSGEAQEKEAALNKMASAIIKKVAQSPSP
jgi:hypothetical protein